MKIESTESFVRDRLRIYEMMEKEIVPVMLSDIDFESAIAIKFETIVKSKIAILREVLSSFENQSKKDS